MPDIEVSSNTEQIVLNEDILNALQTASNLTDVEGKYKYYNINHVTQDFKEIRDIKQFMPATEIQLNDVLNISDCPLISKTGRTRIMKLAAIFYPTKK